MKSKTRWGLARRERLTTMWLSCLGATLTDPATTTTSAGTLEQTPAVMLRFTFCLRHVNLVAILMGWFLQIVLFQMQKVRDEDYDSCGWLICISHFLSMIFVNQASPWWERNGRTRPMKQWATICVDRYWPSIFYETFNETLDGYLYGHTMLTFSMPKNLPYDPKDTSSKIFSFLKCVIQVHRWLKRNSDYKANGGTFCTNQAFNYVMKLILGC